MKLDCSFTEIIKRDFGTLWTCKQHDGVLEISTPYLYPNSKFARVFITQCEDRYIVTEDGDVAEVLKELLPQQDFSDDVRALAADVRVKSGSHDGYEVFFKDCTDPKHVTSLVLDVASFATKAANVMFAAASEDETAKEKRFVSEANQFIESLATPDQRVFHYNEIEGVPDVKFNSVIRSEGKILVVAYISGRTMPLFRARISDAALSFKEAWATLASRPNIRVQTTVPLLDNFASGYKPQKLMGRFMELEHEAQQTRITWTNRELLRDVFEEHRNN